MIMMAEPRTLNPESYDASHVRHPQLLGYFAYHNLPLNASDVADTLSAESTRRSMGAHSLVTMETTIVYWGYTYTLGYILQR